MFSPFKSFAMWQLLFMVSPEEMAGNHSSLAFCPCEAAQAFGCTVSLVPQVIMVFCILSVILCCFSFLKYLFLVERRTIFCASPLLPSWVLVCELQCTAKNKDDFSSLTPVSPCQGRGLNAVLPRWSALAAVNSGVINFSWHGSNGLYYSVCSLWTYEHWILLHDVGNRWLLLSEDMEPKRVKTAEAVRH